jgi:hypothetical protein
MPLTISHAELAAPLDSGKKAGRSLRPHGAPAARSAPGRRRPRAPRRSGAGQRQPLSRHRLPRRRINGRLARVCRPTPTRFRNDNPAFTLVLEPAQGRLIAILGGDDPNTHRTSVPAGIGPPYMPADGAATLCALGSGTQPRGRGRALRTALSRLTEVLVRTLKLATVARDHPGDRQVNRIKTPCSCHERIAEGAISGDLCERHRPRRWPPQKAKSCG